jgi:hypothetical protein
LLLQKYLPEIVNCCIIALGFGRGEGRMKFPLLLGLAVAGLVTSQAAHAGALGKFVSGLVGRGIAKEAAEGIGSAAVRGAARTVPYLSSAPSTSAPSKLYTPNVLTVDQLVECLKKANTLDQDGDLLQKRSTEMHSARQQLDQFKSQLEVKRKAVNRNSKVSIDTFNAELKRHNAMVDDLNSLQDLFNRFVAFHNVNTSEYNTACAKHYYSDDMERARALAGI